MTDAEKIAFIQSLIDDVNVGSDEIGTYLTVAANRIFQRLYPFGGAPAVLPSQYDTLQCELVVRMIARRGGEGETAHSENGISRTWGSVDDEDILGRLVPFVGVL